MLLALLGAGKALAIEEVGFSYEDLDRLIQRGEWSDAYQRLADVGTAERPRHWDSIVEKIAVGYLKLTMLESASTAETVAEDMVKAYPGLNRSRPFKELRHQNAFDGFQACFEAPANRDICTERLADYVKGQGGSSELAFRAGKLVGERHRLDLAYPFFQKAITPKTRSEMCGDPTVQQAMIAALGLGTGDIRASARNLASRYCWEKVGGLLQAEFDRVSSGAFVTNTCPLLRSKGALTRARAKKCSTPP